MISTRHNGDAELVTNKFGATNVKPACVIEYNKHMGGINKADQLTSYYTSARKTIRWQLKVFFHLVDLSLWNAVYMYNFGKPKKQQMTYLKFRDSVVTAFLAEDAVPDPPPQARRNLQESCPGMHLPKKMPKRQRCRYCALKRKRPATFFCCACCSTDDRTVSLCTGKTDCFTKFHEERLYRNL